MLKRFSATKRDGSQSSLEAQNVGIDALVLQIKQLVWHRGYDRAQITSACLKRYLPSAREHNWQGESLLRHHHATAQIHPRTFAYLIENVRIELQMAHERLTG